VIAAFHSARPSAVLAGAGGSSSSAQCVGEVIIVRRRLLPIRGVDADPAINGLRVIPGYYTGVIARPANRAERLAYLATQEER
jgi:hypothetical protein